MRSIGEAVAGLVGRNTFSVIPAKAGTQTSLGKALVCREERIMPGLDLFDVRYTK